MSRPVYLRPEALLDVKEASTWYEERDPGLGLDFLDELGLVLERVEENPLQFPEIGDGTRRALLRRFPYGIYFLREAGEVVVLAVLHLHRNPEIWRRRR